MNGKSLTILFFAATLVCLCGCPEKAPLKESPEGRAPSAPVDSAFMPVMGQLNGEILEIAARSESVKKIQRDGILAAALKCEGDNLCRRDEYGASRGFEIDILRRIATHLGVKLNVVDGEADLYGGVAEREGDTIPVEQPYYFDAENGWRYFSVSGDEAFAMTISAIIRHLYETGTYQQMYKNNFSVERAN